MDPVPDLIYFIIIIIIIISIIIIIFIVIKNRINKGRAITGMLNGVL